jgi:hypothetical protein
MYRYPLFWSIRQYICAPYIMIPIFTFVCNVCCRPVPRGPASQSPDAELVQYEHYDAAYDASDVPAYDADPDDPANDQLFPVRSLSIF